MKILFICQRNNGRSQMAKGLYNKITDSTSADSAGIAVDKDGQLLRERAAEPGSDVNKVVQVMNEIGVDVSGFSRRQFKDSMIDDYDKVVVLLEPESIPAAMKNNPKIETWHISDPKTRDIDGVRATRDQIETKVRQLITER